jgi:hypothetical protein
LATQALREERGKYAGGGEGVDGKSGAWSLDLKKSKQFQLFVRMEKLKNHKRWRNLFTGASSVRDVADPLTCDF